MIEEILEYENAVRYYEQNGEGCCYQCNIQLKI